jgi:hypothetical protein
MACLRWLAYRVSVAVARDARYSARGLFRIVYISIKRNVKGILNLLAGFSQSRYYATVG